MPELLPGASVFWGAFWELSRSRVIGYQPHPIEYAQILAWLDENGIEDPTTRRDYVRLIQTLDVDWRNHHAKEAENA